MKDYMDGRVAFGSGLVPLGRQAEKRKELSFASPNLFATQKPTKRWDVGLLFSILRRCFISVESKFSK